MSCVSVVVWCLLMYIPGTTIVHQGSFAIPLLLYVLLGISLGLAFPRLAYVLLAIQVFMLFPLFAITDAFMKCPPRASFAGGPDAGMACLAVFSFLTFLLLAFLSPNPEKLVSTVAPRSLADAASKGVRGR